MLIPSKEGKNENPGSELKPANRRWKQNRNYVDGTISGGQGSSDRPDLTVNTPFEVWMDILAGKADGQQMFLEQKYTIEGDPGLLMQIKELLGGNS